MRALVARAVRAAGHEIAAEAADAEAAVAALARELPDALIVDGRLPDAPIAELVTRLRAASPNTAILILATLKERELVRSAGRAGAHAAVLRPLKQTTLTEALKSISDNTIASGENS